MSYRFSILFIKGLTCGVPQRLACLSMLAILAGCAGGFEAGVTTGGQQDVAGFRRALEDGAIPNPESMTVEGLLSEHSIDLGDPIENAQIFMTAAGGWNVPFDSFGPLATLALGFGTTINADNFERPDLELALVIDISGSMLDSLGGNSRTTKFNAVRVAVDRLLANLTPADRVSVVTFNDQADVRTESARGDDIAAIKGALDRIVPEGGTNLQRGLTAGYEAIRRFVADGRHGRLILFTDALPTEGLSQADDFVEIMQTYADDEIGATIFGVGADFGDELAQDIAQVRGGNYFLLGDYDRVVSVFDEDFDFLVAPIAYDVRLVVNIPFELDIESVHGLPGVDINTHVLELTVPTLFLSTRQGGGEIIIRLRAGALVDFDAAFPIADLTYTYRSAAGGRREAALTKMLPAALDATGRVPWFENDGAQRACLLTDTALVLRDTAEDSYFGFPYYYGGNIFIARQRLDAFLDYFDELAAGLEDRPAATSRSLSEERAVIVQFLSILERY